MQKRGFVEKGVLGKVFVGREKGRASGGRYDCDVDALGAEDVSEVPAKNKGE